MLFSHLRRMEQGKIAKVVTEWELEVRGQRGKPTKKYIDFIERI